MKLSFRKSTNRTFLFVLLLAAWICIRMPSPVIAGQVITIDSDRQYEYAEKAFKDGDFERAVLEYRRFLDFFPEDRRARKARFQTGSAFYKAKRFNDAIAAFQAVIRKETVDGLSIKSYQTISQCYLKQAQTKQAVVILEELIDRVREQNLKDHIYHTIGWIYLERLDFDRAESYFNQISDQNREKYRIDSIIPDIGKARGLGEKSPVTAGILSVIPGAGYLYLDRNQDALISFLVNGAMIFAAYEAFDNDLYVLGGILSFIELGFYSGSIYGTITSTHKANRSQKLDIIKQLKQRTTVGLQPDPRFKGIALSLRYNF